MEMQRAAAGGEVAGYAGMFAAMGNEARLRIMRLLLSAHPEGMTAGEIHEELKIPNSTLSHHLDKLKNENLVIVRRDRQFLWYTANSGSLTAIMSFLYAECCSRNKAVPPESFVPVSELSQHWKRREREKRVP